MFLRPIKYRIFIFNGSAPHSPDYSPKDHVFDVQGYTSGESQDDIQGAQQLLVPYGHERGHEPPFLLQT